MSDKKYTAGEVAKELLDKAADVLSNVLDSNQTLEKALKGKMSLSSPKGWKYGSKKPAHPVPPPPKMDQHSEVPKEHKAEDKVPDQMNKVNPESQTTAQMAEVKVPQQPKAPEANPKMIIKPPLKLKKFMDSVMAKKSMLKGEKSKHDRCVEQVKEASPDVRSPHAVCVSRGVVPEKWKK